MKTSPALVLIFILFVSSVQAEELRNTWLDAISVHAGQGVSQNMLVIPEHILKRTLAWDASYFSAIELRKSVGENQHDSRSSVTYEYELTLLQHRGLQHNSEVAMAYMLRTVDLDLHLFRVNLGVGMGLSYAIGQPYYEEGTSTDPNRRYHLQFFLPVELEWYVPKYHYIALVSRIHHRSGVGGLIAPKRVGSNFITLGLRYFF